MGDKSPKNKDKAKKQTQMSKQHKRQAHEALMASKQRDK